MERDTTAPSPARAEEVAAAAERAADAMGEAAWALVLRALAGPDRVVRIEAPPPKGRIIVTTPQGLFAMRPDANCRTCYGRGGARVDGQPSACHCVVAAVRKFVEKGG